MRIGINLLPEFDWSLDRERWQRVEDLGFDHAWTYDHLAWRALADGPWHATIPTLTAAALVTQRIRLGALVTTPNFRHPVPVAKELMTLDVISGGRLNVAVGAGAEGYDSSVLGQRILSPRERHERFIEFAQLLDGLLSEPVLSHEGGWFDAVEARTIPGPAQRPRPPFLIAANGPKGMRLAVDHARVEGDGWVTLGAVGGTPMSTEWWETVESAARKMDAVLETAPEPPVRMVRLLYLSSRLHGAAALSEFCRHVERAAGLGFTDVVLPWPRSTEPFKGDASLIDDLAALLPDLRHLAADPNPTHAKGNGMSSTLHLRDTTRPTLNLRPWEWGPASNHITDPRHPEAIADGVDRVVAAAGHPDDN